MSADNSARRPTDSPIRSTGRPEHRFAAQFTNQWAWRFDDALHQLAKVVRGDFGEQILRQHDRFARHDGPDVSEAWIAFVKRTVTDGFVDDLSDQEPPPQEKPADPFLRLMNPGFDQPATPAGWVTRPIGAWERLPAEAVYDPRCDEVQVTSCIPPDQAKALQAEGWSIRSVAYDGVLWERKSPQPADDLLAESPAPDPPAAVRAALARLGSRPSSERPFSLGDR